MPGFIDAKRHNGLPIIQIQLAICGQSSGKAARALVDTGATHLVATPTLISAAGLKPVGTISNTVVGSAPRVVPTFAADIIFHGYQDEPSSGRHAFSVTDALVLSETLIGYEVIIGWDILRFVELSFYNDETFSIFLP